MKPFGLISDTHLHLWSAFSTTNGNGVNSRLQHILDSIWDAAAAVKAAGGDTLYHAGDLFHVRGSIPPSVLNPTITLFNRITSELGIKVYIIAGNHDLESADSNKLGNAAEALRSIPNVAVCSSRSALMDRKIALLPWRDKLNDLREDLQDTAELAGDKVGEWTVIIHAPVNGVIMGIPDHGFDATELESYGFKLVASGHYHDHKMLTPKVMSIGASTHQTWGDVGTKAGYVIVSESGPTHHCSNAPLFLDYDDLDEDNIKEEAGGNYLRIKLDEVTESEVRELRELALEEWSVAGVVIKATPKREVSVRKDVTVEAGESLMGSVAAWIDANEIKSLKEDLTRECELILSEAEGEE